nr:hypothetical protein [Tanacetum cinerariifolium]
MNGDDDKTPSEDTGKSSDKKGKKRPLGNRKAIGSSSQVGLEAKVVRLKCLLVDIRGRIEGDIGSFTCQKQMPTNHNIVSPTITGGYVMNPCNMQCGDQVYCLHPEVDGKAGEDASIHDQVLNGCDFKNLQCLENQNFMLNDFPACATEGGALIANPFGGRTKRKVRPAAGDTSSPQIYHYLML